MKRLLPGIISILLPFFGMAQDTTHYKTPFIAPQLYWNAGKTMTLWTNFETKIETGASLMISDHYLLIGEYGTSKLSPNSAFKNIEYRVDGTYYRLGIGYMAYVDPANRIGIGFKYGKSDFADQGIIHLQTASGYNPDYQRDFERDNLEASWGEFNLLSQKYLLLDKEKPKTAWINRLLSIGVAFRYRWKLSDSTVESIPDYYAIPGYGRASAENVVAFNLYLQVALR